MGLTPDQLYDLTFREFAHKMEGFNEINEDHFKQLMISSRFQAALVLSGFSGKQISPSELCPFPWEKDTGRKFKKIDKTKFEKLKNAITKVDKKR